MSDGKEKRLRSDSTDCKTNTKSSFLYLIESLVIVIMSNVTMWWCCLLWTLLWSTRYRAYGTPIRVVQTTDTPAEKSRIQGGPKK